MSHKNLSCLLLAIIWIWSCSGPSQVGTGSDSEPASTSTTPGEETAEPPVVVVEPPASPPVEPIETTEEDYDYDGLTGASDNCPKNYNPDQQDTDGDKIGDECDQDKDGDAVLDEKDNCPLIVNAGQENKDGDKLGDACDIDNDNDEIADLLDNCANVANSEQGDIDGDGAGDLCDDDDDGDNVKDNGDNCPLVPNSDQADTDGDGEGDECENDYDGDEVANDKDNCQKLANAGQEDTDGDGLGNACDDDDDDDDIKDQSDNCQLISNADQTDTDVDDLGNACDDDDDGDGVADTGDYCPLLASLSALGDEIKCNTKIEGYVDTLINLPVAYSDYYFKTPDQEPTGWTRLSAYSVESVTLDSEKYYYVGGYWKYLTRLRMKDGKVDHMMVFSDAYNYIMSLARAGDYLLVLSSSTYNGKGVQKLLKAKLDPDTGFLGKPEMIVEFDNGSEFAPYQYNMGVFYNTSADTWIAFLARASEGKKGLYSVELNPDGSVKKEEFLPGIADYAFVNPSSTYVKGDHLYVNDGTKIVKFKLDLSGGSLDMTKAMEYDLPIDPLGIAVDDNYIYSSSSADKIYYTLININNTAELIGSGYGYLDCDSCAKKKSAMFSRPSGLAVDDEGNLLVADAINRALRSIKIEKGKDGAVVKKVSTVAGNGPSKQPSAGLTNFYQPSDVVVEPNNKFAYVTLYSGYGFRLDRLDLDGDKVTAATPVLSNFTYIRDLVLRNFGDKLGLYISTEYNETNEISLVWLDKDNGNLLTAPKKIIDLNADNTGLSNYYDVVYRDFAITADGKFMFVATAVREKIDDKYPYTYKLFRLALDPSTGESSLGAISAVDLTSTIALDNSYPYSVAMYKGKDGEVEKQYLLLYDERSDATLPRKIYRAEVSADDGGLANNIETFIGGGSIYPAEGSFGIAPTDVKITSGVFMAPDENGIYFLDGKSWATLYFYSFSDKLVRNIFSLKADYLVDGPADVVGGVGNYDRIYLWNMPGGAKGILWPVGPQNALRLIR